MKCFVLILCLVNVIKTCQHCHNPSDSCAACNKLTRAGINSINKCIKLNNQENEFLEKSFDLSNISVKSINDGLCFVYASLKENYHERIRIKIEKNIKSKSWFSEKTNKTYCLLFGLPDDVITMEYLVANKMHNSLRFEQFYPEQSRMSLVRQNGVNMYAYHNYADSNNLKDWYGLNKINHSYEEIEMKLKIFFKQMHDILVNLLDNHLLYTNFKPENILINNKNKKGSAFITNLDSAVILNNEEVDKICVITKEFFPPLPDSTYETSSPSKWVDRFLKIEKNNTANRLLSWTYCISIFSLVCNEFQENLNEFSHGTIYKRWSNPNAPLNKFFKCHSSKISKSLGSFFETCLFKHSNHSKLVNFKYLTQHEWFDLGS